MPNLFLNLPVPASSGVGAAVDVSNMGATKTVIVGGTFKGAITLEYATDDTGTVWAPVPNGTFSVPGRVTFDAAARWMRTSLNGSSSSANVDVGAAFVPPEFRSIGAAPVDISTLPLFKTVVSPVACLVEISEDGTSWSQAFSFPQAGGQSALLAGKFARCLTGTVWMGAVDLSGGGGTSATPVGVYVYRPGATGADAPGGNVYTVWSELMAALDSTRKLGQRILQFDSTFQNPAPIPAGVWNMTDVVWTIAPRQNLATVEFLDGATFTIDPTFIPGNPTGLLIEAFGLHLICNRTNPLGPVPFDGIDVYVGGNNVKFGNTNPAALPMFRVQGFNILIFSGENANGGIQGIDYPLGFLGAPIIDLNGGGMFISGGAGNIANRFLTDLSVGGFGFMFASLADNFWGDYYNQWDCPELYANGGTVFMTEIRSSGRMRIDPTFIIPTGSPVRPIEGEGDSFVFAAGIVTLADATPNAFAGVTVGAPITITGSTTPANDGTYVITEVVDANTVRFANPAGVTEAFGGAWNVGYRAGVNEFVPVDTTEAAIVILAPCAGDSNHSISEKFTVKDVGNNASVNNITIMSIYGDTFDGAVSDLIDTDRGFKTWRCWGSSEWSIVG